MINVIVAGAAGRMGSRLIALIKDSAALTLAGAIESKGHQAIGKDAGEAAHSGKTGMPITDDLSRLLETGDVVIDFSVPEATLSHLRAVAQYRRAMVIGTTGFSPAELEELRSLARQVPCVFSPNMSVGVNLLYKVIGEMAKTLGDDYDIEVIEAHHRLKKDAPSGTALKIAEVLARAVNRDHTVIFGGIGERIEVTHRASSRDTFARGALRAAHWVVKQSPGLYDMMDVLNLK